MLAPIQNQQFKNLLLCWPEKAMLLLYESYYGSLIIIAQELSGDLLFAEEIVQKTFSHIWMYHDSIAKQDDQTIESYLVGSVLKSGQKSKNRADTIKPTYFIHADRSLIEGNRLSAIKAIRFMVENILPLPSKYDFDDNFYCAWHQIQHSIESSKRNKKALRSLRYAVTVTLTTIMVVLSVLFLICTPIVTAKYDGGIFSLSDGRLPDNSRLVVSPHSVYNFYHHPFERVLNLEGRGYVQASTDSLRPFVVKAGVFSLKTIGADFFFEHDANGKIGVDVLRGKIEIEGKCVNLVEGESVIFQGENIVKSNTAGERYSWYTGTLAFSNATLKQVILELEQTYNTVIEFDGLPEQTQTFSGSFHRINAIEEVLEILCNAMNLQFAKREDAVYTLTPLR